VAGDLSPAARTVVRVDASCRKEHESELRHGSLALLSYVFPVNGVAFTAATVSCKASRIESWFGWQGCTIFTPHVLADPRGPRLRIIQMKGSSTSPSPDLPNLGTVLPSGIIAGHIHTNLERSNKTSMRIAVLACGRSRSVGLPSVGSCPRDRILEVCQPT
jgi:hypothetical protein